MDVEKASLDAVPLTLDTCVEDHFTHEACVKLHFDLIRLITLEDQAWRLWRMDLGPDSLLWEEMLKSIPEVKSTIIFPLSNETEVL